MRLEARVARGLGLSVCLLAKLELLLSLYPVICVTLGRPLNSFTLWLLYLQNSREEQPLAGF